jgi:hypothetical protein
MVHTHPLAEVFGFPVDNMSAHASRHRKYRLCPFNNVVPNCTKDKAQAPLGVCSIFHENEIVITCPVRFRQNWCIAEDAAKFFFGQDANWTSLSEVRLKDAEGASAGNIDLVLCEYDKAGTITDFGALEVQAVYVSGNIRNPFEAYMKTISGDCTIDWTGKPNQPRPDYLSSSRKRLAPQLIFKGGILDSWGKKTAVALNSGFFKTLPQMQEVSENDADIAWLVYDIRPVQGGLGELCLTRTVYTKFDTALSRITRPRVGEMSVFMETLQKKLDAKLSLPPVNNTIDNPFE